MRAIKSFSSIVVLFILFGVLAPSDSLFAQCPTIGSLADPTDICSGNNFDLVASGLTDMAMVNNTHSQDFGIDFVHFGPGGTGTNSYLGGISLGIVPFASLTGTDPNQIATLSGVGAGLAPGTYTIYANLSPTPAEPSCAPQQNITLVVSEGPVATVNDVLICNGTSSFPLTITSTVGTPTSHSIDYDAAAETAGFVDVATGSGIYSIPNPVVSGTYSGTVTYEDANNCVGTDDFTITILPTPQSTVTVDLDLDGDANPYTETICSGESPTGIHDLIVGDYAIYNTVTTTGLAGSSAVAGAFINDGDPVEGGALLNSSSSAINATYVICSYNNGPDGDPDNTNPDDCIGNCFTYTVKVEPLPTIEVAGSTTICSGGTAPNFTLTGTPGETVMYNIDGGVTMSIMLNAAGTAAIPASNTVTQTLNLVAISGCSMAVSGSATVTVQDLPALSLAVSSSTVCEGDDPAPTFNITGGPANGSITYNTGGGALTGTLDADGALMINAATNQSTTIIISEVSTTGATTDCSATIVLTETITHYALPTVAISSGDQNRCDGDPAVSFTLTGTPGATVSYTKTTDGVTGPATSTTLNPTGTATILGSATQTCTIDLVSVTSAADEGSCTATVTGTSTITVNDSPTITITDQTICTSVTSVSLTALEGSQIGGEWVNSTGIITTPGNVDPTTGPFTYTYTDPATSCTTSKEINYNIVASFDAGNDRSISVCNEDISQYAFDLFDALGGTPDAGGIWNESTTISATTPSSGVTISGSQGSVSFQGVLAGTYEFRYRFPASGATCLESIALVTVTVTDCFDLSITKTKKTAGVVTLNSPVDFDIVVTNVGTVDAYDVDIVDNVGTCFTYLGAAYDSHTSGAEPAVVANMTTDGFNISYIPAGGAVTVTVNTIISCTASMATNTADITGASSTAGGASAIDSEASNNSNSAEVVIRPAPMNCGITTMAPTTTCNSNGMYDLEVCFGFDPTTTASDFVNISVNGQLEVEHMMIPAGTTTPCTTLTNIAIGDGSIGVQILIEEVYPFKISEFHYDNTGTDVNEFIEVQGLAGADLTGYQIIFYNGSVPYTSSSVLNLTGVIGDEGDGCGAMFFTKSGIQNGPADGFALVDPNGSVIEFLSYEGIINATSGPAIGLTSIDVGVSEDGTSSNTNSIFINSAGVWSSGPVNSANLLNPGVCPVQTTLTGCFRIENYNEPTCEVICGDLACNNKVQVSLAGNCEQCISPDMILEGDHDNYEQFTVSIDSAGINIGDCIDYHHAGLEYKVTVSCGVNSCWGKISVEDKLPPTIPNCPLIQRDLERQLGTSISCADLDQNWDVTVDLIDSIIVECNRDFTVTTEQGLTGDMCTDDYRWTKKYIIDYPQSYGGRDTVHACIISLPVTPINLSDIICPADQEVSCRATDISPAAIFASYSDTTDAYAITQAYPYIINTAGDTVQLTSEHCNILSNYADTELDICQFKRKQLRKWTFIDWCTSQVRVCDQVIKMIDNEAMVCVAPPEFDIPLGSHCLIDSTVLPVTISRGELVIYSGCANVIDTTIYYKSKAATREAIDDSPFELKAIKKADGTFILPPIEVPFDSIWLKYEFTNACGESCSAFTEARVIDNTPPTPVCNPDIVVAFSDLERGDDGLVKIFADAFDADSHDNSCGPVYFKIIRHAELNNSTDGYWNNSGTHGGPDYSLPPIANINRFCDSANGDDFGDVTIDGSQLVSTGNQFWFDDHIKLCCTDDNFKVMMRVFDVDPGEGPVDPRRMHSEPTQITGTSEIIDNDLYGHFNDCWIDLEVQDKTQILGACVPFSLFCDEYPDNPMDNAPQINMACSDENIRLISRDSTNISECGNGLVIRDWYARRSSGEEVKVCTQSIILQSRAFDPYSIKWPKSYVDGTETGRHFYKDTINDICLDSIYQVPLGGALDCSDNVDSCEPTWDRTACSLLGLSSLDDTLFVDGDACMKIIRTWSVIDWCIYNENTSRDNSDNSDKFEALLDDCEDNCDPNNVYFRYTDVDVDGFYTYQQVLKIVDDQAPVLSGCRTRNIGITEGCTIELDISKTAGDGTGCGQSFLKWLAILQDTTGRTLGTYPGVTENPGTYQLQTRAVPPGIYNVIWLVEDACGNESTCEEQYIVEDAKAPTPICIRDLSTVLMPSTGSLGIWASDYDLKSEDNCVAPMFSFSPDTIQAGITLTCDDMDGFEAKTFSFKVYVFDEAGNSDFCVVSLRVDSKDICGGTGEGGSAAIIQGYIATENGDMVSSAQAMVNTNLPEYPHMVMTQDNGEFAFGDNPLAYDYDVSIEKDGDDVNGVSTLDIVLIQKHILGISLLDSPYKVIAADANGDQRVSASDLVQIRKLILGVTESFPTNTSWRFVDADQTFSSVYNPWPFTEVINLGNLNDNMMNEDFVGVKVGDVNGNVKANSKPKPEVRSSGTLTFNIEDRAVKAGEEFSVAFSADNFDQVLGYQLTLSHEGLRTIGVSSNIIEMTANNVATFEDHLTMSWNSENSVITDEALFSIQFRADRDMNISDAMSINSRKTVAEAYISESLNIYDIALSTEGEVSNGTITGSVFTLNQNQPNPFAGETTISFVLPETNEASLTIMDVTGKLIMKITDIYQKGYNEVSLRSDEIQSSGVIYYQLESGKHIATKKMIIIE